MIGVEPATSWLVWGTTARSMDGSSSVCGEVASRVALGGSRRSSIWEMMVWMKMPFFCVWNVDLV